jgi:peptidoglycan/xylan/chitin deacetylase (PgdA/CDA1 family)
MALGWVFGAMVLLWVLIYLIPDLLFHHFQWGAFSGSRETSQVALTFDDGPGDDTPALLDVLKAENVRATFFIIVERALKNPAIVRRMIDEGHEVGLHMTRHVSAYALSPWGSFREIQRALNHMASITGVRPTLFRPPWGHVNLGTWLAVRHFGLVPVFWNIAPDDWRDDRPSDVIARYVVDLAQPGTVVVLHDAGGARQRTVQALPHMAAGLRALGLKPTIVSEISEDSSILRRVWTWWEIRFTRGWKIQSVPNSSGGEPYLRMGRIAYRGAPVRLANGQTLRRGDPMGEIHFGNPALAQVSGRATSALRVLHGVMTALADLNQWLKGHPEYADIGAIGGVTLLDAARAIERLGFVHVPVRGWTKWSMWIYLSILMAVYHRDGWRTLRRFRRLRPVLLIMDMQTLTSRYGQPRVPPGTSKKS